MERFNRLKAQIQSLDAKINKAENRLNNLVYKLYGLTSEEVQFIS